MSTPGSPNALTRREFVGYSAATAGVLAGGFWCRAAQKKEINVAMLGVGARGQAALADFTAMPGVRVTALADPDTRILEQGIAAAFSSGHVHCRMRDDDEILDDENVRAVIIAAPASRSETLARLACLRGKDVYLSGPFENPGAIEQLARASELGRAMVQTNLVALSSPSVRRTIRGVQSRSDAGIRGVRVDLRATGLDTERVLPEAMNEIAIALAAIKDARPLELRGIRVSGGDADVVEGWCRFDTGAVLEVRVTASDPHSPHVDVESAIEFFDSGGPRRMQGRASERIDRRFGSDVGRAHLRNFVDAVRSGRAGDLNASLGKSGLASLLGLSLRGIAPTVRA